VRKWIGTGRLRSMNTSTTPGARARFVILPEHLAELERTLAVSPAPKPARRRKQPAMTDYYPEAGKFGRAPQRNKDPAIMKGVTTSGRKSQRATTPPAAKPHESAVFTA